MKTQKDILFLCALAVMTFVACGSPQQTTNGSTEPEPADDPAVEPDPDPAPDGGQPESADAAVSNEAAVALIADRCAGCHSVDEVYEEQRTAEQWPAIVDDMVSRGAQLSEEERALVLAYLSSL